MKIQTCVLGMIGTNCYLIINESTNEVIIVDPAEQAEAIKGKIEDKKYNPVAILLTHGHFDHIMAAPDLSKAYNIPIYSSEAEKELLERPEMNLSEMMNTSFSLTPDKCVKDNEVLTLAGMNIKVILTPGHTAGGVCYYFYEDAVLISGDTLFLESTGRTDFPTGDGKQLLNSIQSKLMILNDDLKVYPGHGARTTIGHERKNNPYLSDENFWD
jgi:glyoxylase-like metal-dependent hydrolase (beta-lactamase superfamily II)